MCQESGQHNNAMPVGSYIYQSLIHPGAGLQLVGVIDGHMSHQTFSKMISPPPWEPLGRASPAGGCLDSLSSSSNTLLLAPTACTHHFP